MFGGHFQFLAREIKKDGPGRRWKRVDVSSGFAVCGNLKSLCRFRSHRSLDTAGYAQITLFSSDPTAIQD